MSLREEEVIAPIVSQKVRSKFANPSRDTYEDFCPSLGPGWTGTFQNSIYAMHVCWRLNLRFKFAILNIKVQLKGNWENDTNQ